MERNRAVEIMMRDIKTLVPSLPQSLSDVIENRLALMWQVGWESRGKELAHSRWNKAAPYIIQQFDKDGRLIGEYKTPKDAYRYGGICRTSLFTALKGRVTEQGHTWKRVSIEGVSEVEK